MLLCYQIGTYTYIIKCCCRYCVSSCV